MNRRTTLKTGLLSWTPFALPSLVASVEPPFSTPRARACLLLYMDGGPSHVDLLDMKPQAPAEIRGPFLPIATSVPGIAVSELMPNLALQMHHVVQIRSVRHQETVHDPAVYQTLTGFKHFSSAGGLKVEDSDLPHMGSAFRRADPRPAVMPPLVEIPGRMKMQDRVLPGQSSGILGPFWDPFQVEVTPAGDVIPPQFDRLQDVTDGRLKDRRSLLEKVQYASDVESRDASRFLSLQEQALSILERPSMQTAFDLDRESPATRDRYGRHRHGTSVLLARRLLEAGARFVTVYWGKEEQDWADGKPPRLANNPWDTHRNHFPLVRESLVPRADQTLTALLADMHDRGLLDETLIVWMGEFGRTPRINRQWASRDHWPHAYTVLMAGAKTQGGSAFGRTDRYAESVVDDPVSPADLTATIFQTLGVDPRTEVPASDGSPYRLSNGQPIEAIF
ncbi:DUF1501 domain-containing protein [bacterium]|nr:DUF1501 domain-containing protein [bacterium]